MNKDKGDNEVTYLRIDDIIPNRFQPREIFDETGLEELADSIKEHGIIQPIVVRPIGDKYELIAGERRTKASAMAGLTTIPAIIRDMDDTESAKVSLLENLQRKNLSAIEEARTYKRILDLANMTQEELAKTMGKSQPMVANKLRLLSLPEEIQDALIKNQISERHARSLLNIKNKEEQLNLLERIKKERLTVRELDKVIKEIKENNNMEGETSMNNNFYGMQNNNNSPTPNQNYGMSQNYNRNFGNMGLNDYQSTINNGMFNNIPNFNNTGNTMPQPNFNSMLESTNSSSKETSTDYDYSSFGTGNDLKMPEENETPDYFGMGNTNNSNNNPENYSSLGSMFDGSNVNQNVQNDFTTNDNNPNLFMSQIKENSNKPAENQFLPNFDTMPNNNMGNTDFMNNNNMNMGPMNDFNSNMNNNFDFPSNPANNMNNFNQGMPGNNFNQGNFGSPTDFAFNNMNDYQKPIEDFSFPSNNPQPNYQIPQGGLFNQPLNIVDVPGNSQGSSDFNEAPEENTKDVSDNQKEEKNEFSDLFNIPPVPVEPKGNTEETEKDVNQEEAEETKDEEFKELDNKEEENTNQEESPSEDLKENTEASETTEEETKEPEEAEVVDEVEVIDVETPNTETETSLETPSEEVNGEAETETINEEENKEDVAKVETEESKPEETTKSDNQESDNQYIKLEPVRTIFDTKGAVLELKKTTDAIKQNNISIDTEEIEFDDYYQITIKIKK